MSISHGDLEIMSPIMRVHLLTVPLGPQSGSAPACIREHKFCPLHISLFLNVPTEVSVVLKMGYHYRPTRLFSVSWCPNCDGAIFGELLGLFGNMMAVGSFGRHFRGFGFLQLETLLVGICTVIVGSLHLRGNDFGSNPSTGNIEAPYIKNYTSPSRETPGPLSRSPWLIVWQAASR